MTTTQVLGMNYGLAMADDHAALARIDAGWVADEAVMAALYCFLRSPDDFLATVRRGANTAGDSDSIACIAGGIIGAYLGYRSLPREWMERLEKSDHLAGLAGRLEAARTAAFPAGTGGAS